MEFKKFGFISLGLIGGSIAMSIREKHPDTTIVAYARRQETLAEAINNKLIDKGTTSIDDTFKDCDIIFLCAPVSVNNEILEELKNHIGSNTIITDVGSVKTSIHECIERLGLNAQFIGGHPMAGSEKTGLGNATPILLENAYYILTPTKEVPKDAVDAYLKLVEEMGAISLVLDYKEHDYVTAAISHVPHLVAAALANLVHDHDTKEGTMKLVAAGGFKDITRIASSSPDMWEAICMSNTENIANLLDDYIDSLKEISAAVRSTKKGYTYDLFKASKEYRDSFANQPRGPIKKLYSCYVDIPDQAGAFAMIALILANKKISLKNMGIVNNREFEGGVLQIEFEDQHTLDSAVALLRSLQYTVYERN